MAKQIRYEPTIKKIIDIDKKTGKVLRVRTDYTDVKSRTKTDGADRYEINAVVARSLKSGDPINHVSKIQPMYGDFTDSHTYGDSLNRIAEIQKTFSTLPAELRNKFNNDPSQLITFLKDQTKRDEAIKLGLVAKPPKTTTNDEPAAPTPPPNDAPAS